MIFLVSSILITLAVFIMMPKNLTYVEIYTTSLFAIVFQLLTDIHLEFKYNLYGYFEEGVDYKTLLVIFFIYPLFSSIYLNHFPYHRKKLIKLLYIIAWTIFSLCFEYSSVLTGVFYYNNWKLGYSALIYPIVYLMIYGNLIFIRKLFSLNKNTDI
ncbi:CBO0543 family protein [Ornithinibacillus sp. 179-J 7C1 HS]|uniref:CBO0543 family protein n=1 Tax=Ornithinibacillus sp. 179-J 7C1 HS TaxID=3142384 RepID=UPI0039A2E0C2